MNITPSIRSKASRPHDEILQEPAMIAIEERLHLRSHLPTLDAFRRKSLSQDVRVILDKCQDLHGLQQPPSCTELEDYALRLYFLLRESYSRDIVQRLSYATGLKLSLIVWHFYASSYKPSPGLLSFLRSPIDEMVWERLYIRYQDHTGQRVQYDHFKHSFEFLLSPQIPLLQQPGPYPVYQQGSGDSRCQLQTPQTLAIRPIPRQGQFIPPENPSTLSSHRLQRSRPYTGSDDNCGRSHPIHLWRSLGDPVGGHDGHHTESLRQSQSTSYYWNCKSLSTTLEKIPRQEAVYIKEHCSAVLCHIKTLRIWNQAKVESRKIRLICFPRRYTV